MGGEGRGLTAVLVPPPVSCRVCDVNGIPAQAMVNRNRQPDARFTPISRFAGPKTATRIVATHHGISRAIRNQAQDNMHKPCQLRQGASCRRQGNNSFSQKAAEPSAPTPLRLQLSNAASELTPSASTPSAGTKKFGDEHTAPEILAQNSYKCGGTRALQQRVLLAIISLRGRRPTRAHISYPQSENTTQTVRRVHREGKHRHRLFNAYGLSLEKHLPTGR
jgi:hypothetical protein